MLTDLNWIAPGKPFPPPREAARLNRYRENEMLFDGRHTELFRPRFARLEERLRKRHIEPDTVFGYPQLLSKKTADFVCGEPPTITVDGQRNEALRAALDKICFDRMLYEAVMDVSRFGDAPFKATGDRVSAVSPDCWFPVVDPLDAKHITHHVIAFPTEPDDDGKFTGVYVEIHSEGRVEVRHYRADDVGKGLAFGNPAGPPKVTETGLAVCAVQVLRNVSHSKSVYGMDDYAVIHPLIGKIIWRLHCMDNVLDKHSEPSLSGPDNALSYDRKTGLHYLDLGNYFARMDKDAPDIKYLTWDGNLESSFQEIELLLNQLYTLSEMGAAFLEGSGGGSADSGAAIRLRMTSPRAKAQRLAGINTQTVKQIVSIVGRQNGMTIEPREVAIDWHDGIPDDPAETLEMRVKANGGLPVESQVASIQRWNGCDEAGAEAMLEQIQAEQAAVGPAVTGAGVT